MSRRRFWDVIAAALVLVLVAAWILRKLLLGLPDIRSLETYTPPLTTRVYDRNGDVIAEFSIEKRTLLTLAQIPVELRNAVIAVEDDQFFSHWGVSPKGIIRSAIINFIHRRVVQGASTITQQLAKQIFLTRERTMARKVREALLAVQLERNYSKSEILQFYLNQVYFGEGAYGVKAAAHVYFGKDIQDLTLPECALLAGLIRSPRGYSPFVHSDRARKRRAVVLDRMKSLGLITAQQADAANATPLPAARPLGPSNVAPYFVSYIQHDIERRYGSNALWQGGLQIYTTLDAGIQQTAERVFNQRLSEADQRMLADWTRRQKEAADDPSIVMMSSTPPAAIQGAFLVLDVKTGAIRAMIGGRNSIFNRATQARRQPGSTFKPFVWAAALDSGMTAATLVDDSPLAYYYDGSDWRLLKGTTDFSTISLATAPFALSPDFKIWVPADFDNKFLGPITLRRAIAKSRNIASIRLVERVGPPRVVEIAHRAGIVSNLNPVLALGLGTSVVTPLEMANAFETFANGGIRETPYSVERIEDNKGRELESHEASESEAFSPQLAYLVTNLLKGVVSAGTGRYASRLKRPLAAKTGTSNENRDLWFIGYTPDLVAAAWMGYDDFMSIPIHSWTAATTVVPWWTEIMGEVLKDYPKKDFPVPSGVSFQKIDGISGMLPLPTCPRSALIMESFKDGTTPTEFCPLDHEKDLRPQLEALLHKEWGGPAVEVSSYPAEAEASASTMTVEVSTAPEPLEEDSDGEPPPEPRPLPEKPYEPR